MPRTEGLINAPENMIERAAHTVQINIIRLFGLTAEKRQNIKAAESDINSTDTTLAEQEKPTGICIKEKSSSKKSGSTKKQAVCAKKKAETVLTRLFELRKSN